MRLFLICLLSPVFFRFSFLLIFKAECRGSDLQLISDMEPRSFNLYSRPRICFSTFPRSSFLFALISCILDLSNSPRFVDSNFQSNARIRQIYV